MEILMTKGLEINAETGETLEYEVSPKEPLPDEVLATRARQNRDFLLRASDWTQLEDVREMLGESKSAEWTQYRQALRDIPQQDGFPQDVTWPVSPEDE